jgi:rifampin ADP-ribosylating transferase
MFTARAPLPVTNLYNTGGLAGRPDDPNLTDKKFPGNITKSYRSRDPFRVTGEVLNWTGHPAEQLKAMRDRVAYLKQQGVEAIE